MRILLPGLRFGGRVGTWRGTDEPAFTIVATGGTKRWEGNQLVFHVERDESVTRVKQQRSGAFTQVDVVDDRPSCTITAGPTTDVYLARGEPDDVLFAPPPRRQDGKPPYRVPTVAEVTAKAKRRRRAPVVVSTFSGAGGSCFGYRIAGYDVKAAVEIAAVPASSYEANFPGSKVFVESIRDVDPKALLKAAGVKRGELDLFDGSPPCTSFSSAGKRAKTWGQVWKHAGVEQRIDDLFFDWAKLVDALQPKVFVAENVSGLARGAAIGYFKAILRALRDLGYLVRVQLLDADQLGVPQHRERLFFVGLRRDVAKELGYERHEDLDDLFPRSLPWTYTVRDALPWLDPWLDPDAEAYSLQGTPFGTPERIASGKATPPERTRAAADREASTILAAGGKGGPFGEAGVKIRHDTNGTGGVRETALDETPGTLTATPWAGSQWSVERVEHDTGRNGREPRDVTDEPAPTIVLGTDDPAAGGGARQHWKVVSEGPDGTVLRRKFTILEVKRLCSFPDDYVLNGSFAEQWAQCGNSVPPLMMAALSGRIRERVFDRLSQVSKGAQK